MNGLTEVLESNHSRKNLSTSFDTTDGIERVFRDWNFLSKDDKVNLLPHVLSDRGVDNILIQWMYDKYVPDKPLTDLNELRVQILRLANLFTWVVPGSEKLESADWDLITHGDKFHQLADDEIWLFNTVQQIEHKSVTAFVNRLVEIFSAMAPDYEINAYYQYFHRDDAESVVIRFVSRGSTVEVGL